MLKASTLSVTSLSVTLIELVDEVGLLETTYTTNKTSI